MGAEIGAVSGAMAGLLAGAAAGAKAAGELGAKNTAGAESNNTSGNSTKSAPTKGQFDPTNDPFSEIKKLEEFASEGKQIGLAAEGGVEGGLGIVCDVWSVGDKLIPKNWKWLKNASKASKSAWCYPGSF